MAHSQDVPIHQTLDREKDMFLRVDRGAHSSLYECDRIHIGPVVDGKFSIGVEKDSGRSNVEVEIDKAVSEAVGVYCMNNSGQTVDTIFRKFED